jgi:DNA-binding transcriptional LysR family regulator
VVPVLASNWLISRLRSFHRSHPDIDLDIQSTKAMANVKAGEADVAIRWGKGPWSGLEQIQLFADELFPVCSKSYLDEIGELRTPGDLRRAVLLRHSLQPWKPWLEKAGLDWSEPAQGPMFNDRTLMLQAAVDGHGVALGQRALVDALVEEGSLVRLFDVSALVEEGFHVVFVKASLQRPEVSAFVDWIESMASEDRKATRSA